MAEVGWRGRIEAAEVGDLSISVHDQQAIVCIQVPFRLEAYSWFLLPERVL